MRRDTNLMNVFFLSRDSREGLRNRNRSSEHAMPNVIAPPLNNCFWTGNLIHVYQKGYTNGEQQVLNHNGAADRVRDYVHFIHDDAHVSSSANAMAIDRACPVCTPP